MFLGTIIQPQMALPPAIASGPTKSLPTWCDRDAKLGRDDRIEG